MQNIIKIIIKYKGYITYTALVVICLSLISMGEVSKLGGFRTFIIASVANMQDALSWIPNPGALRSENEALRELNLQLSSEVIKMRKSLIENQRLKNMINLRDTATVSLIPAEVVGKSSIQMRNYITLNRGSAAGIKSGMAVRTDAGLVGVVIAAGNKFSFVELLNNRNVRIAAKILRSQIDGLVAWEGGEYLLLKNIPTSFDIEVNDIVATSNYSNKYPADVPVGKVIRVEKDPGSLFHKIVIEPYAQFNALEQVYVLNYLPSPEILNLANEVEEKLLERRAGAKR